MNLVEESFSRLFPGTEFNFSVFVSYSGKFKPYNATVRKIGGNLYFSLSRSWEATSEEIVIGIIQHLLIKILRRERFMKAAMRGSRKITSLNMQLYDDFIKGVSEVAAVNNDNDEILGPAFARVNEKYFMNLSDKPNLRWGSASFRKLASFDYHTNTITISALFSDAPQNLLDYLMHHEMLHKRLKFNSGNGGRAIHHSSSFKKLEQNFEGSGAIEAQLDSFLSSQRRIGHRRPSFSCKKLLLFE